MNKVAIAFSTKNRTELTKQSIEPLLQPDKFDLWWVDGSTESEAENLPAKYPSHIHVHSNVRGGADSAIAYGLTTLLNAKENYEIIGLVENDVKLHPDFFGPTMALFEVGRAEGLEVGAVSARCYEDRVLVQRDGHALVHNTGAGCIFLTRHSAQLVLQHCRTTWTAENRRTFCHLTDTDIGRYWAFRTSDHWLCWDWSFDKVLAQHGLASLALTPSPVEMIGQIPPLHEQGLTLVTQPVELLRNDDSFKKFADRTQAIREGKLQIPSSVWPRAPDGTHLIFPHQISAAAGKYWADWKLKWSQGFGPFAWEAFGEFPFTQIGRDGVAHRQLPSLEIPIMGSCAFLVSGGKNGGRFRVTDAKSGYEVAPDLAPESQQPQMMQLAVPAQVDYRVVTLTALDPGVIFYGLQTRDPQACLPGVTFDHSVLPPV